jgi:hypothetical protein
MWHNVHNYPTELQPSPKCFLIKTIKTWKSIVLPQSGNQWNNIFILGKHQTMDKVQKNNSSLSVFYDSAVLLVSLL